MTQRQPPTCTFELRAETGPCETCGSKSRISIQHRGISHLAADHPYLGPSLGVCGVSEEEHPTWTGSRDHAFTTPSEPANA